MPTTTAVPCFLKYVHHMANATIFSLSSFLNSYKERGLSRQSYWLLGLRDADL